MEDWVKRAMERWPDVPALFGWLRLDRRGRWLIRDELISRPQIIDTIASNYAADEQGRWYFQNGPQRGYVALDHMPLLLRTGGDGETLFTHTGRAVTRIDRGFLDEDGGLMLSTEHGPAALDAGDLGWALERLTTDSGDLETALSAALTLSSHSPTPLRLQFAVGQILPLQRLDSCDAPATLGFVRLPQNDAATQRPPQQLH